VLSQRIFTAIVLAALFISAVLLLSNKMLAGVLGVAVLVGAWEWTSLATVTQLPVKIIYVSATALAMLAVYAMPSVIPVLGVAVLWWCTALAWVVLAERRGVASVSPPPMVTALLGWLVLIPAWAGVVELHVQPEVGPAIVLTLMMLVWGADIAAFFAGRRWGQNALASKVSPAKSWEGVLGGVFAALALAGLAAQLVEVGVTVFVFLCLALLSVSFSILGDLFESLLKRAAGVKDSGTLLPGHGGVLDRVDSLTAAAPIFTFGLLTMRVAP